MSASPYPPATWGRIRAAYERGEGTIPALAARYGVSPHALAQRKTRGRWAALAGERVTVAVERAVERVMSSVSPRVEPSAPTRDMMPEVVRRENETYGDAEKRTKIEHRARLAAEHGAALVAERIAAQALAWREQTLQRMERVRGDVDASRDQHATDAHGRPVMDMDVVRSMTLAEREADDIARRTLGLPLGDSGRIALQTDGEGGVQLVIEGGALAV